MKQRKARKTVTVRHGAVWQTSTHSKNGVTTIRKKLEFKSYMTRKGESK
jgi:hypothetical protein